MFRLLENPAEMAFETSSPGPSWNRYFDQKSKRREFVGPKFESHFFQNPGICWPVRGSVFRCNVLLVILDTIIKNQKRAGCSF